MARIGVVCIHGIGTSYLLASQVRKIFGGDAAAEVSWWGDSENWKHFDFLVSTTPLEESGLPVVVVAPFLDDAAVRRIGEEIRRVAREGSTAAAVPGGRPLAEQCAALEGLAGDIAHLLGRFSVHAVPAECVFAELAQAAGERLSERFDESEAIRQSLLDREALSSQVIPELGLVLLHCRTAGVDQPVFAVVNPAGGVFRRRGLRSARTCVVMLIPDTDEPGRTELMGCLSAALIESEGFLDDIVRHRPDRVLARLQDILRQFLIRAFEHALKG
jgi:mannitol operon transcriptional antiterminator